MERQVGRRAFVGGSVAASAGLLSIVAGRDDAAHAQAHSHGQHRSDPMLRLFIRESTALRAEIKRDRLRGEHARRLAAALRMVATYGGHTRLDETVKSHLRLLVRQQGRDAVMRTPFDYDHAIEELRAHGAVDPEELPDPNLLTHEERTAGLDELLSNGVTPVLARQATLVARGAATLDRYGRLVDAPVVQVALRQDDPPPVSKEECEAAWETQIAIVKAASIFVCAMPPLWEICVLLQADVLLGEMMKLYFCSDNP